MAAAVQRMRLGRLSKALLEIPIRPSHPSAKTSLSLLSYQRRNASYQELDSTKGDRQRVVVLGSGWAGYVLSRQLDPNKYQTLVVSPRSYFVFTPLLASTSVGTLEFRVLLELTQDPPEGTALEPIRSRHSTASFYQGWADDVDFNQKLLRVEESVIDPLVTKALAEDRYDGKKGEVEKGKAEARKKGQIFDVSYDKLIVAVGCYSQTFGTKGVKENALFLKDVGDARRIRKRVLECFETAALPTTSDTLRKQILRFAVVGGGPTGIEFSAELHDLINEDLAKIYPSLLKHVDITVYDVAPNVLSMFDESLGKYAMETFSRQGIRILTSHHVEELRPGLPKSEMGNEDIQDRDGCYTLKTKEKGETGIGMCVWSTGLMMNPFVEKALEKCHTFPIASAKLRDAQNTDPSEMEWIIKKDGKSGGLVTDDQFRVKLTSNTGKDDSPSAVMQDVFALGDCAVMESSPGLPATAQVANQKAEWLAQRFNKDDLEQSSFSYKNLGVMAYIGNWNAVMQSGGDNNIKGRAAWLIWRGAYLTKSLSIRGLALGYAIKVSMERGAIRGEERRLSEVNDYRPGDQLKLLKEVGSAGFDPI
ncbi:MAG: hypothetical protein M1827_000257 [Pycnora praestabilis]|nr:MAG: hypothetical protein M1827_000257 [Pycnora praestabilis]